MIKSNERIESVLGLDVAKDTVVLHDLATGRTETIKNRYETLVERLEDFADGCALAVCEATGGYEDELLRALVAVGIPVHRGDPSKIKHFARSLGRAKTDALDARMLAIYGRDRAGSLARWTPPPRELDALARCVARRQQIVRMRQGERTRLAGPRGAGDAVVSASFEAIARVFAEQIAALDAEIRAIVKSSPALKAKVDVLQAMPGFGPVISVALLGNMPEIGTMPGRNAASLGSCAPHPQQSGKKDGRRKTGGGRRQVKADLYTAAMSAVRGDNQFATFFKRLIANGKSKRCAYTAVARKLLVVANARIAELLASNPRLT